MQGVGQLMNEFDKTQAASYSHTQTSPLCLVLYGSSLACLAAAYLIGRTPTNFVVAGAGLLIGALAPTLHTLTVEDRGDRLAIRFGPVPMFHRTVRYVDIVHVEIGRTLLIDGWGIHYSIRGGWVWNLWGRDCVVLRLRTGAMLRIGTDEAIELARFLENRTRTTTT
jgi:hypothetical protein